MNLNPPFFGKDLKKHPEPETEKSHYWAIKVFVEKNIHAEIRISAVLLQQLAPPTVESL